MDFSGQGILFLYYLSMKTRKPKNPDTVSQEKAAKSWVGNIIRDGFENKLGLVRDTEITDEGLVLLAQFQGEKELRTIYMDSRADGECFSPEMPKARYRHPRREDLKKIGR